MGRPIKAEQIQLTIPRRCCILLLKQLTPRKGTVTAFYDANKAVIAAPYWKDTGTNTMSGGYLASLTVPAYSGKTVAFARFGCYWIDSHSIITVNEEIG